MTASLFDFIDANRFIPMQMKTLLSFIKVHEGISYLRESTWETTSQENFMLDWTAKYYIIQEQEKELIATDFSTVRVFK
jgi:hypothetical protein